MLYTYCIKVDSSAVLITFDSDIYVYAPGFVLTYEVVEGCGESACPCGLDFCTLGDGVRVVQCLPCSLVSSKVYTHTCYYHHVLLY